MEGGKIEYSTKMLKNYRNRLQKEYDTQIETEPDDELITKTGVPKNAKIAEDLTEIKITKDMVPAPPQKLYKLPPNAGKKENLEKNVPEIEFKFKFTPRRLEARPFQVPKDFGRDYLQDELVNLNFQFSRLSNPY